MSKKAANVQRKILKDLQKAWRAIVQDHFKRLYKSLAAWRQNFKKMRGGLALLYSTK